MSNKPRFYIIIAALALIVILGIVFVASSASSAGTRKAGTVTIIINAEIGVSLITVDNQNEINGHMNVDATKLPFKFTCDKGDTIQLYVSTLEDYTFNTWWIDNAQRFNRGNPLIIKVDSNLELTALVSYYNTPIE